LNGDLLRLVDSIHRDKDIDKEVIFDALEDALLSAARKYYGPKADLAVFVDRETGEIQAFDGNEKINPVDVGRIAAQTAKQVIMQKIRDAEQDAIYRDYSGRVRQIVSGTIQRFEGSSLIVNLGRTEGILPRSEQVPEENYRVGDRIRCLLLEVNRVGSRVRLVLSRAHTDFIRRLFELEVPEIGERIIEIMAIAREPGYRTKVAVASADSKVDCVGACVGVRGSRIKNIVAELNDEKIDIVRWSDSRDVFIANALKPAEVRDVVVLNEFNRLCDCDIDILSEAEAERELQDMIEAFEGLEGLPDRFPQRLFQMGYSVEDIAEGATAWRERFDLPAELTAQVIERAIEGAERIAAAREAAEAAEAEAKAAEEAAEAQAQQEAEATKEAAGAQAQEPEATEEPGEALEREAPAAEGEGQEPSAEATDQADAEEPAAEAPEQSASSEEEPPGEEAEDQSKEADDAAPEDAEEPHD